MILSRVRAWSVGARRRRHALRSDAPRTRGAEPKLFLQDPLRREPFDRPAVPGLSCVTKTIVKPIRTPLPEFDASGRENEAAPTGGQGNEVIWIKFIEAVKPFLDLGA